jgi:hypothetical protein
MEKQRRSWSELQPEHLILNYLLKHPEARDTVKGIAKWWMLSERIDWTIERVDQALASLVGKELVLVSKYEGQEPIYRLNRQKLEEIKSRLASQNSEVRRQNSEG